MMFKKKAKYINGGDNNNFDVTKYSTFSSVYLQPLKATIIYYFKDGRL